MCTETIDIKCRLLRAVCDVGSYCDGEDSIYVTELPQMYTLHQLLFYLNENFDGYEYLNKNFDGYEYRNKESEREINFAIKINDCKILINFVGWRSLEEWNDSSIQADVSLLQISHDFYFNGTFVKKLGHQTKTKQKHF